MILDNLTLFLRIVEKGGMAAAGRDLDLSPATVSERLAALEAYYGTRLLTRTTRSLSLTDEGRELVQGARRILAEAEEVEARIRHGTENISGTIHLSAPVDLGRNRIVPLADQFMALHPLVNFDIILNDGYIDIAQLGLDLALRFGALSDSTLRSRKLGENHRIVCAAPCYLEKHGRPKHPDDLQFHNCLLMRFGIEVDREWRFMIDGRETTKLVRGNRIANEGELVRQWCINGHGLSLKSLYDVDEDLRTGRLVALLKEFSPAPNALQVVYPAGATQPRRVRMFIDFLREEIQKQAPLA